MLKAGALYIVLVISLLLASLCLSVILLGYYYRVEYANYHLENKLERNLTSGINILLETTPGKYQEEIIDLYGEESDTVVLKSQSWGVFDLGKVTAYAGRKNKFRSFFHGYAPSGESKSALYLCDNNRPISLCGKTKITGNVYIPEAGFERGYIGSRSFEGNKYADGKINKSGYTLYPVNEKLVAELKSLIEGTIKIPVRINAANQRSVIHNSFIDTTILITSGTFISINGEYSGNIIFRSRDSIEVSSTAKLSDVILIAPVIKIADNFTGNLQIFANQSIKIGRNVKLKFPSVAGIVQKEHSEKPCYIKVDSNTYVKGQLFALKSGTAMSDPRVSLAKGSILEGQLYTTGYGEIYGKVYGHVAASKFFLNTGGHIYENHLLDVELNFSKLSPHYAGSALLPFANKKKILKWLD